MSLAAYLAKNYLNSSNGSNDPSDLSTRPKKRHKKDKAAAAESSTLIIADDEDLSLRNASATNGDDDDRPVYDQSYHSAEFRKSKKNNWKSLDDDAAGPNDDAEADRILATAAADQATHDAELADEDAPAIVAADADPSVPKMSSGVRAGLQTAADSLRLEAEEARQQAAEEKAARKARKAKTKEKPEEAEEETVYRDATGRRIDVSMKRAEARAAEEARLKAERQARLDNMGEVQVREAEKRREELEEARFLPLARGVDDEEINDEMKAQLRWDDPMAGYMSRKLAEEAPVGKRDGGSGVGVASQTRNKEYAGAAEPNRYGIRPGWRWDGVDRGNGFEKEWFQARGKKARTRDLEYQWQMDE